MSKKQQYTTKFYEDNGGVIDAVTRDESGKVRPLTFDEARKYNNLIASSDNDSRIEGYWTCTAWSVPRRTGEYRGDFVASVTYNGMIGGSNSWDCYDVRLVCILKSDINVWID